MAPNPKAPTMDRETLVATPQIGEPVAPTSEPVSPNGAPAAKPEAGETPSRNAAPATPDVPATKDVAKTLQPTQAVVHDDLLIQRDAEALSRLEPTPKEATTTKSDEPAIAPASATVTNPAKEAAGAGGETPDRRQEPPTREAIAQIRERIEDATLRRPQRMTIRLNPDSLGEITLTIKQAGSSLVADFAATDDRMRHALVEHRQALAASLELKQIQLQDFRVVEAQPGHDVAANLADRRSPQHQAHDPRPTHSPLRHAEPEVIVTLAGRTWATTGLDLRI